VIWTPFSEIRGPKIIDELNRLPPGKQALLLDIIENRRVHYQGKQLPQDEMTFYATVNYDDGGNTAIIPPLLDRFDVCAECKTPVGWESAKQRCIPNKKVIEGKNDVSFKDEERKGWKEEIAKIPLSQNTLLWFDFLNSEIGGDSAAGIKRPGETPGVDNHYDATLRGDTANSVAGRAIGNGVTSYMRSLAFLNGAREVTPGIAATVHSYSLPHRIDWNNRARTAAEQDRKDSPEKLDISHFLARRKMRECLDRFNTQLPDITALDEAFGRAYALDATKEQREIALQTVQGILSRKKGTHPFFDTRAQAVEGEPFKGFGW
jgi:MoxR-like ATPase